jgi:imidazolonepropionase-like amidohydrolase
VLEGKLPLVVHCDELTQIEAAVAFSAREGVKMILAGGYDAPLCAALLKRHNVPVLAGPIHRLPMHKDDPYDLPFTLPERLREAGLKYCIIGEAGGSNVRNLPYHAAAAASHGLSKDEALKSITLYPAQILGVAERLGSIEAGKDATLIVTTGDPLDIRSQVEQAFIAGRTVDLNNKQRELWLKYREKYRRLEKK